MPGVLADLRWPIVTERLSIRPAVAEDARRTWVYWRLPETVDWLPSAPGDLEPHLARFVDPDRLAQTLIVEHDGVVIGDIFFAIGDGWVQAEVADLGKGVEAVVGYVFDPAWGGRGLATEAVAAVLDAGFRSLGLRRITASLFAENDASARLLERLGFRRERHGKADGLHRTRGWLDGFEYALLADEWVRPAPR